MAKPRTLYDKIWDDHLVDEQPDGTCLLYIDRHLVHEVTSPQAFDGLRMTGRKVRAPEKTLAVVDHNIPTSDRNLPNPDPESAEQIRVMAENARDFGIEYFDEHDRRQGIVHIIGPEQGFTLARHHDRVRRQPHVDARRVRRARARHRHLRGRARAGDADADPEEVEEHARGRSTASCRPASPRRTSSSRSSARSARRAAPAMSSNTPARRSARSRWKGA